MGADCSPGLVLRADGSSTGRALRRRRPSSRRLLGSVGARRGQIMCAPDEARRWRSGGSGRVGEPVPAMLRAAYARRASRACLGAGGSVAPSRRRRRARNPTVGVPRRPARPPFRGRGARPSLPPPPSRARARRAAATFPALGSRRRRRGPARRRPRLAPRPSCAAGPERRRRSSGASARDHGLLVAQGKARVVVQARAPGTRPARRRQSGGRTAPSSSRADGSSRRSSHRPRCRFSLRVEACCGSCRCPRARRRQRNYSRARVSRRGHREQRAAGADEPTLNVSAPDAPTDVA